MFMDESISLSLSVYEISSKILALWYSLVTILQQIDFWGSSGACLLCSLGWRIADPFRAWGCLEASSMFIIGVPNHTLGQPPAPSVWNSLTVPQATASSHSSAQVPSVQYLSSSSTRTSWKLGMQSPALLPKTTVNYLGYQECSLTCFLQSLCLSCPGLSHTVLSPRVFTFSFVWIYSSLCYLPPVAQM